MVDTCLLVADIWGVDLERPARPLISDGVADVVATLAATSRGLTGRVVARLSGLSHSGAHKVLVSLGRAGLVHSDNVGSAIVYRLNREHVLVPPLLEMLDGAAEVRRRLVAEIGRWSIKAVHVSLFGSVARKESMAASDIDLLVVRPEAVNFEDPVWRLQLEDLARRGLAWSGLYVSWLELSYAEVVAAVAADEPIVAEWTRDGVLLAGVPFDEVRVHGA